MLRAFRLIILGLATVLLAAPLWAQQSQRFGPYELHYSVVNTTFLAPEVAAAYGLTRGRDYAILNLALQEHLEDGSVAARTMQLKGTTWDLTGRVTELAFQEVRENPAIYYLAEFRFFDEEFRHFEVHFRPQDTSETLTLKVKHQMYQDLE
ncbi:DUF4426 domain-containing protein [Haliea sp. E17]|uniref:DUF4426 domain-containing protein n=1 Tax=Haliea sp. E17 TaxID=3401576 RepID=UPI003AB070B9